MRYFLGRLNKIKEKILLIGYGHGNAFEYSFIRNNEKKMNSLKEEKNCNEKSYKHENHFTNSVIIVTKDMN